MKFTTLDGSEFFIAARISVSVYHDSKCQFTIFIIGSRCLNSNQSLISINGLVVLVAWNQEITNAYYLVYQTSYVMCNYAIIISLLLQFREL